MAPQPSNKELAKKIDDVDRKVDDRAARLSRAFGEFKREIRKELQPFHDYIVGQDAITKNKTTSNITITPDIIKIILWLIAIIGALVGVSKLP